VTKRKKLYKMRHLVGNDSTGASGLENKTQFIRENDPELVILEWSTCKVLHLGRLLYYSQTLNTWQERLDRGKHSSPLRTFLNCRCQKLN